jgi:hypothetical protein
MSEKHDEAVVLELAPLPREQLGPFIILGVEKDATKEQVEAHWAQRVIRARKGQAGVPLADINWAREVLNDLDRRVQADVTGLNLDTTDLILRRLADGFGVAEMAGPTWQSRESDTPPADDVSATPVPDPAEVRAAITIPDVPEEFPAVQRLLEAWACQPLDPWALDLSTDD